MLMMTPDGRVTEWNKLPLILGPEDLALLLGVSLRTLRRRHQLGDIPAARNRTWSRSEIKAWVSAGRPSSKMWERIRPKQFQNNE